MIRRKLIWAVPLAALFLVTPKIRSQVAASLNGAWWTQMSTAQKTEHIQGYFEGRDDEFQTVEQFLGALEAKEDKTDKDPNLRALDDNMYEMLKQLLYTTNEFSRRDGSTPTFQEVSSGIDSFYKVPENLPVCISHAILIEAKSFSGIPLPDKAIAEFRAADGQSGCH
ncbi:MAG: hypothetical protein ACHP8A_20320 [Terriglobales bacterium]